MEPLIESETLNNGPKTIFPVWEVEDRLVDWAWNEAERALPVLIALATHAFYRYDITYREYILRGIAPYVWPILEEERDVLRILPKMYSVDRHAKEMAEKVLNELLQVATIDEVATGAFSALRWIARRAGAGI